MLRELFFRGSFSVFIWRYETAFRNLDKLQVRSLFRYLIQKRDFLKNFFRQAQKHKLRNGSERMFFEEHWKLLLQLGKGRGYTKHFTISFSVTIIWLLLGSLLQLISDHCRARETLIMFRMGIAKGRGGRLTSPLYVKSVTQIPQWWNWENYTLPRRYANICI